MAPKASKRKEKEILKDTNKDKAPSESPEDLPKKCLYNMGWRNTETTFEVINQGNYGSCWTIAYTRMIASHLHIHGKTKALMKLSAKHLLTHIKEKDNDGYLKKYEGVIRFLKEEGLVLERDCYCIATKTENQYASCDKKKDKMVFKISDFMIVEDKINEKQLIELLKTRGPIAAHIIVDDDYYFNYNPKDDIYYGPKNTNGPVENHIILITGIGTSKGIHYFEFQNTWGKKWGDKGYGKFAREISLKGKTSLIKAYMYPKLLDQVFEEQG